MEQMPQYQVEHIVMAVRNAMLDSTPRVIESVSNTIRQELTSPASMKRFDDLLDRYYKSNADLTGKFEQFNNNILQNQAQMTQLLAQIVENAGYECPNNPDIVLVRQWLDELLHGNEYLLKQQVRDLLESGMARRLRNVVATAVIIMAVLGLLGGIAAYFEISSAVSNAVADIVKKQEVKSDSTKSHP